MVKGTPVWIDGEIAGEFHHTRKDRCLGTVYVIYTPSGGFRAVAWRRVTEREVKA